MGNKPSNHFQMDRPESGGADRKGEREASGQLELEKKEFAKAQKAKHERLPKTPDAPERPGSEEP